MKKMKRKLKKQIIGIITSVTVIIIALLLDKLEIIDINECLNINNNQEYTTAQVNNTNEYYDVVRVVDGDTFVINYNGKEEKVRLIGVDTPESVHPNKNKNTEFGNTVSRYSKKMLTGKQVAIEFDVEQRDKYGRLLAYVYLDGHMYNKMLLERGYAKLATYPPNVKYVDDFTEIQKQARRNKVGLWAY